MASDDLSFENPHVSQPIETNPVQTSAANQVDGTTNAMIRKAIGDRLANHLGADEPMPPRLQALIEQLRRQDSDAAQR